jgi:hypothetical protein
MIPTAVIRNKGSLLLIAGALLPLSTFGDTAARITPVPRDPLELATGQIELAGTPASRVASAQLLARARQSYSLRTAGQAYDLKVTFTVDSSGQTNYDGAWQMEDRFAPGKGHLWTATSASGYTTTQLVVGKALYSEGTASSIPLRLEEARGAIFDPIPSVAYVNRASVRTLSSSLHDVPVTCVLLSSRRSAGATPGRDWDEAEECIDPQSGLLLMHSQVPGRYSVYDYSNAPSLGSQIMPRTVTLYEGGRVVSKITVESLQPAAGFDPSLFVPTEGMKANGHAIAMTSATKLTRVQPQGTPTAGMTLRPVCVFGVVTPTGQLVEAHSLQPSDPNSQAAVEDAKGIDFSPTITPGAPLQQHFVFVIEKFASPE